jgi:hypothetical protein
MAHSGSTKQFFLVVAVGYGAIGVIVCFVYLIGSSRAFKLTSALIAAEPVVTMLLGVLVFVATASVSGGRMTDLGKSIFSAIWYCCRPVASLFRAFSDDVNLVVRILSYAVLFPILVFAVVAGHDFVTKTWPVNLSVLIVLLLLGIANWQAVFEDSHKEPALLGKVIAGVLGPMAFGLTGVLCLQLAFNLFDMDMDRIRHVENAIGYASDKSGWLDFSPWSSVCMTGGVIILGLFTARWKTVSSYLSVKSVTHKAIAAITCLASFTFFSQVPVRHFSSLDNVQTVAQRRSGKNEQQSKSLVIQATGEAMRKLTPEDRAYYGGLFEAVDAEVPYRYQRAFLSDWVQKRLSRVDLHGAREQISTASTPTNQSKKSDEDKTATPRTVRDESLAGLQDMFSEIVGLFRPEFRGIAGKFTEELVDQISDKIFAEGIRPQAGKAFDYAEAKIQSWITQTLNTTQDRTKVKQEETLHLDLAALREEVKLKERELQEKEESAAAEKRRAERVEEPVEDVE